MGKVGIDDKTQNISRNKTGDAGGVETSVGGMRVKEIYKYTTGERVHRRETNREQPRRRGTRRGGASGVRAKSGWHQGWPYISRGPEGAPPSVPGAQRRSARCTPHRPSPLVRAPTISHRVNTSSRSQMRRGCVGTDRGGPEIQRCPYSYLALCIDDQFVCHHGTTRRCFCPRTAK